MNEGREAAASTDLDHCLLDFSHARETEVPSEMLKRPGMDVFLSAVYDIDIVVWSQTAGMAQ